jgi:hypothetical protein
VKLCAPKTCITFIAAETKGKEGRVHQKRNWEEEAERVIGGNEESFPNVEYESWYMITLIA